MHVNITFETDGAAFEDDFAGELARILEQARRQVEDSSHTLRTPHQAKLRDTNGNTVGRVEVEL